MSRFGKLVALVALTTLMAGTGHANAKPQTINAMQRIVDLYDSSRRGFHPVVDRGGDTALACMNIIFLDWVGLMNPIIHSFHPGELNGSVYENFTQVAKTAQAEINQVFEVYRPGLTGEIRRQVEIYRGKNQAPPIPRSLQFENIEEDLYVRNLKFCRNEDLLAAVAKSVPPVQEAEQTGGIRPVSFSSRVQQYQNVINQMLGLWL